MATITASKNRCIICNKEKTSVQCEGCLEIYCHIHLIEHHEEFHQQLNEIEMNRNLFQDIFHEQKTHPEKHPLIKQIHQWESESIQKIQQTAYECKQIVIEHVNEYMNRFEMKLSKFNEQLKQTRQENNYHEIHLNQLNENLIELTKQFDQLPNVLIKQDSTTFIKKISVTVPFQQNLSCKINMNTKWKQNGITIAGGNGDGDRLNQLSYPISIDIDEENQCIYIVDTENHRIVQWNYNANIGQIIAGGHGQGNQMDQLNEPTNVIYDKYNDSIIISDWGNRRVVEWPRQNGQYGETIISNIDCSGLTMDHNGNLYISDWKKNEIRRWKRGETKGVIVAGGNGKGTKLNQFNFPKFLFVDQDYSIYVSDSNNNRVMKWIKDAKEGIIVAGGQGDGDSLTQLDNPRGVSVDNFGNMYIADCDNHRIICWSKGSKEGRIIVGGHGYGQESNQLSHPKGLTFDRYGNLYVVDFENHRVQRFDIERN